MANFLLRTGNGQATFTFLAQPIIKKYARMNNNRGGVYGKDLYGEVTEFSRFNNKIYDQLMNESLTTLMEAIKLATDSDLKLVGNKLYTQLIDSKNKKITDAVLKELGNGYWWKDIIGLKSNKDSLKCANSNDANDALKHAIHQVLALGAYQELSGMAQAMSDMVSASQIDTKKFGNDITLQKLFMNRVYTQYDIHIPV